MTTTIETSGYPETEILVELTARDTVLDLESDSISTTFESAGYTETGYNHTIELRNGAEDLLSSAVEEYQTYSGTEITDVTGDTDFDGGSISDFLRTAYNDLQDAEDYGVDPFIHEVNNLIIIVQTLRRTVKTQEVITEAVDETNTPLPHLADRKTDEASNIAEELEDTFDSLEEDIEEVAERKDDSIDYPVLIDGKIDQFNGELTTLRSLRGIIPEIINGIDFLDNAENSYDAGIYQQAQLESQYAIDAFDEILDSLGELEFLDTTVGEYTSSVEELKGVAQEIRDNANNRAN